MLKLSYKRQVPKICRGVIWERAAAQQQQEKYHNSCPNRGMEFRGVGDKGEVPYFENSPNSRRTTHIKTTGGQLHSAVKHGKSPVSQRLPIRGEL